MLRGASRYAQRAVLGHTRLAVALPPCARSRSTGCKPQSRSAGFHILRERLPQPVPRTLLISPFRAHRLSFSSTASLDNPLLLNEDSTHRLTAFHQLRPEHFAPAIEAWLTSVRAELQRLGDLIQKHDGYPPDTWDQVARPFVKMYDFDFKVWYVLTLLQNTKDEPKLRELVDKYQGDVMRFTTEVGQDPHLFSAFSGLRADEAEWNKLSRAQQRVVELHLQEAKNAGVALSGADKEKFIELKTELSQLNTQFAYNVIDASKAYSFTLHDAYEVEGLPKDLKEKAAKCYRARAPPGSDVSGVTGYTGPWTFTLASDMFIPFMIHCKFSHLRQRMYKAQRCLASSLRSDGGDAPEKVAAAKNNEPVITRILELRQELSEMLGYKNYAEWSLDSKMASSPAHVEEFLMQLSDKSLDQAKKELETLTQFAHSNGHRGSLQEWDIGFWSERLRRATLGLEEQKVKRFFPYRRVLEGMMSLARTMLGIEIVELPTQYRDPKFGDISYPRDASELSARDFHPVPVWDEGMQVLALGKKSECDGRKRIVPFAILYLDPFCRPAEKQSGAWMSSIRSRQTIDPTHKSTWVDTSNGWSWPAEMIRPTNGANSVLVDGEQIPVASLACNFTQPTEDLPSLLTQRDVQTLFHEFGHALHHMMTEVAETPVAGVHGVEWDAIECPSQFMENFFFHRATMGSISQHIETGESVDEEMFRQLVADRQFHAAMAMRRQLTFALADMHIHTKAWEGKVEFADVKALENKVKGITCVVDTFDDRQMCGFKHIFSGAYAAGYYSYMFAEVLSADAYEAFVEAGVESSSKEVSEKALREMGGRFRDTILALGGSVPAAEVFRQFRGRDPTVEPLLKHNGLLR